MKILGVCNANVSGACLIIDGDLKVAVSEERFTRKKNERAFPSYSIDYCLGEMDLKISDIDFFACGAWNGIDDVYMTSILKEVIECVVNSKTAIQPIIERVDVAVTRDQYFKNELIEGLACLNVEKDKICFYDHHQSHAYTAFYPSPFKEALVLTLDGRGDFKSGSMWRANRDEGLELLDSISMFNSLGAFYGYITKILGFTPDRHEGKVTGLAAYGDPTVCMHIMKRMIDINDGVIKSSIGDSYTPFLSGCLPDIEEELSPYSKEDIAAAVQAHVEHIVLSYLKPFILKTKIRTICLAGGLFANVKLNQRILECELVDNIYVFPQMGDGGNSFGGALCKLVELGHTFSYPMNTVQLGTRGSDEDVVSEVTNYDNLSLIELDDYSVDRVAQDIHNGSIIGLFTEKMEYGPRALGSRSIIASATDPSINTRLNTRLNRTEFMPFAPFTLEECASDYYNGWDPTHLASYFMTVCYSCTDLALKNTPAVVHVDKTARPQIVKEENSNALYFNILKKYYELTTIPSLINTSFNNHEEPIVCTPKDAINSLLMDNVDYLVFDNYIVKKN